MDELRRFFRQRSSFPVLILLNIGIWLLVKIAEVVFYLYNQPDHQVADQWILYYLALPASWTGLAARPWTLVTYMFLHIDFFHILFNMLWLFWFGKIFLQFLSSRQLLWTYLLGGLAGGICYVISFNLFPVFGKIVPVSLALGASASVMAIVTAISFYVPSYSVRLFLIGNVRILYLALALFIFDFFAIPSGNPGGHLAHIGGALFGFFYVLALRKGRVSAGPGNPGSIFGKVRRGFSFRKKHGPAAPYSGRPKTDEEYNAEKAAEQKKIDQILEKISRGGYDSLTREEKDFLFRSSGKNRSS